MFAYLFREETCQRCESPNFRNITFCCSCCIICFLFKRKTAYELRISDWSSDVCSSDLCPASSPQRRRGPGTRPRPSPPRPANGRRSSPHGPTSTGSCPRCGPGRSRPCRSEEHTSELQSLMRISYAVFCLKKIKNTSIACEKTLEQSNTNNK